MSRRTIGVTGAALVVVGLLGMAVTGGVMAAREGGIARDGRDARGMWGLDRQSCPNCPQWFRSPGLEEDLDEDFSSAGERIYFTGIGEAGAIERSFPRRGPGAFEAGGGCVTCHGDDGRGGEIPGRMGSRIEAPDIRLDVLTGPENGWTDDDVARAIREGIRPDGQPLSTVMPRWQMSERELNDVIDYLEELSER